MKTANQRFVELDLMRFLAAVAVVVYHYKTKYIETLPAESAVAYWTYAITKFGYLGVDLFFLISGFVIFCSASGHTGGQFAISRITRLYPTMWVCTTLTVLVSLLLLGSTSGASLQQWLANLTLISKYLGYPQIDGVYWTLLVELKFYFVIFLLLVTGVFRHERIWLTVWIVMTATFAIFRQPFFMGWFISPEYSPLFIAGITFFLIRRDGLRKFHIAILLVSFVLGASFAFHAIGEFSRNVSVVDRWIAVLVIALFYITFLLVALRRVVLRDSGLLLLLGGMTYPLYLLHNRIGKEVFDYFNADIAALPLLIATFAAILMVSMFIHVVVERRIADRLKALLIWLLQRGGRRLPRVFRAET